MFHVEHVEQTGRVDQQDLDLSGSDEILVGSPRSKTWTADRLARSEQRARAITELAACGMSQADIAVALGVSARSVSAFLGRPGSVVEMAKSRQRLAARSLSTAQLCAEELAEAVADRRIRPEALAFALDRSVAASQLLSDQPTSICETRVVDVADVVSYLGSLRTRPRDGNVSVITVNSDAPLDTVSSGAISQITAIEDVAGQPSDNGSQP